MDDVVRRLLGYALLLAWPVGMNVSMWRGAHACDGRPCGLWQDVVRKSPNKPRGHINLGQAYEKEKRPDLALMAYQQAELLSFQDGLNPHEAKVARLLARTNIAVLFLNSGELEAAQQILKSAWEEHPGFPGYAANIGLIFIYKGNFRDASLVLSEGIAELPKYPWFYERGKLYLNRGESYRLMGECELAEADYAVARKAEKWIHELDIPKCEREKV